MMEVSYENHTVKLEVSDRLALYSDGITEAATSSGDLFGTDRLDAELLASPDDLKSALKKILAAIAEFTNNHPATDDRTLLIADVV